MEITQAITSHLFDDYKQNDFIMLDNGSLTENEYINELKLSGDINVSLIYQFDINTLFLNVKNTIVDSFLAFNGYIKTAIREAKKRNINIFVMYSSYGDNYFNEFLNKVEKYINEREEMHQDLSEKIGNNELSDEEKTKRAKELQNYTLDKSKKISKQYNKMLIPILAGPIADPTVNSSIDKMRILPFLVNEEINEIRMKVVNNTISNDEDDNTLKEEYYNKLIEQTNNNIRLKQLKSLFKITDDDIKQKFGV